VNDISSPSKKNSHPTTLHTIVSFLNEILASDTFEDSALNGLQVSSVNYFSNPKEQSFSTPLLLNSKSVINTKSDFDSTDFYNYYSSIVAEHSVKKISFAVDAGLAVIQEAIHNDSQLLIVHHGLLWGASKQNNELTASIGAIKDALAHKLSLLLQAGCSLYASHLPLDSHIIHGNAACMAKALASIGFRYERLLPSFEYKGKTIGVTYELNNPVPIKDLQNGLCEITSQNAVTLLPFGNQIVKKIGIATGAASFALGQAKKLNCEVFITGEPKQDAFHTAHELGINVLFAGHYRTETFGVKSLSELLKNQFSIETAFIDCPTGI
jgi:dinuclear metal center YbgI/SA1388 family protein